MPDIGLKGTSNNCPRLSGTPNLPTNDSALFSFRFCAVQYLTKIVMINAQKINEKLPSAAARKSARRLR
jgi:hypothetical protein